jgi:hypothetical protein
LPYLHIEDDFANGFEDECQVEHQKRLHA